MYVGRHSFGVGGHEEKGPSNRQGGRAVSKKGQGRALCWWWARSRFGRVGFEVEG
jgi:hypothetical protein